MDEKLRLPASCTRLDGAECAALEGGCLMRPSTWCYMMGRLFSPIQRSYELTPEEKNAVFLQREHGDIVGLRYGRYTYADGYIYKLPKEKTKNWSISNFFYDVGDFWDSIGL